MLTNALNYFYQNRSGTDILSRYITSGDKTGLAHKRNPDDGIGFIQTKQNSGYYRVDEVTKNSSSRTDTSGGWFDGNDFGKNMSEAGISVWTLQNMYERAIQTDTGETEL